MHTVSRHYLRRRARARAARLNADWFAAQKGTAGAAPYRVVRSERGPSRWRVVR